MTIKRWAGVDAVLRCFRKKIDCPIIRLANDHQIVEAMLEVSCLLDATVSVSYSVEDFRLGRKTSLGDIGTMESDLRACSWSAARNSLSTSSSSSGS